MIVLFSAPSSSHFLVYQFGYSEKSLSGYLFILLTHFLLYIIISFSLMSVLAKLGLDIGSVFEDVLMEDRHPFLL